jgi:DNA-binding NarL/FixJ family response regulator
VATEVVVRVSPQDVISACAAAYGLSSDQVNKPVGADAKAARRLASLIMRADGRSYPFIANELEIDSSTVRYHVTHSNDAEKAMAEVILPRLRSEAGRGGVA